ncbi:MAG: hypothetical protein OEM52_02875 [bacterium]|nr:hypothetical protein [bacterium]
MSDPRVELLQRYFFSRTDMVAFYASWEKPQPTPGGDKLIALLDAHVRGNSAPVVEVTFTNQKGTGKNKGRFRIGSYTPNADGLTKWMCIDFDGGSSHANGLIDPKNAVILAFKKAESFGITSHIECSGGGHGWHLWVFFDPMVPARQARQLGLLLCPSDQRCQNGEMADPRSNRGMEVFPKQPKIKSGGFGNLVWLPFWWNAQAGGNQFYRLDESESLSPFLPDSLATVSPEQLEQTLSAHVQIAPESAPTRRSARATRQPHTSNSNSSAWDEWRSQALSKLPLEAIYGDLLTGNQSSPEWLECRDPASASGDQNPSAGVANGVGTTERGSFHSFLTGETISVFDFLIRTGKATDFVTAREIVTGLSGVAPFTEPVVSHSRSGLLNIVVNNRQLSEIVVDSWEAIHRWNEPPRMFQRGGTLVRLQKSQLSERYQLEVLSEAAAYGTLFRTARWIKQNETGIIDTHPPHDIAKDLLCNIDSNLPQIESVLHTPVFGRDGKLLTTSGYHRSDSLWLHLPELLSDLEIPEHPTTVVVSAAVSLLTNELLSDFPFVSESDRTHAIAAMILPFVRPMITGCTPLHLVEAPVAGSGKGLLCNVISIITTGYTVPSRTLPNDDDELRKMLTSELLKGNPIILLDNADERKRLNSPTLASVLTAEFWTDRFLGSSKMVTMQNLPLWLLTGNNVRMSQELIRRILRSRFDPHVEQPWLREHFRHDDLREWSRLHRRDLVIAILTIIQAWIDAGRPSSTKKLGSYEEWSKVIGGILQVAGIPGFLGNLEALYESADPDRDIWREFVAAWWEEWQDRPVKVSDLNDFCERKELLNALRGDGTTRSQQTKLGSAIRRTVDRVFLNYRLEQSKDWKVTNGKTIAYKLTELPNDESVSVPSESDIQVDLSAYDWDEE